MARGRDAGLTVAFTDVFRQETATPMDDNDVPEMTVEELKQRLDEGASIMLVDVREAHEWQISNLGGFGAVLIPLSTFAASPPDLDPEVETVIYCRTGARSASVTRYLRQRGFARVSNLAGGINAWAERIDPTFATY